VEAACAQERLGRKVSEEKADEGAAVTMAGPRRIRSGKRRLFGGLRLPFHDNR
jgi:hypothetical protein